MWVSKSQLRRSLLVMTSLLKSLENRGYATLSGPKVRIFEQDVSFSISEQLRVIREEPCDEELSGRYEFHYSRFHTRRQPTGGLTLEILNADDYACVGCRKSWRDAKRQKLEDCLNKVVAGLIEIAARKRDHEIEQERSRKVAAEAARQLEEEAQVRAERRKVQQQEQARLNGLLQQAESWRTSDNLRRFIEAVRQGHTAGGASIDEDSEIGRWLSWASLHADRLDPLTKNPPSILDEVIPDEPKRYSW